MIGFIDLKYFYFGYIIKFLIDRIRKEYYFCFFIFWRGGFEDLLYILIYIYFDLFILRVFRCDFLKFF